MAATVKRKNDGSGSGTQDNKGKKMKNAPSDTYEEPGMLNSTNWGRPALPKFGDTDSIIFQVMDCDYTLGDPNEGMDTSGARSGLVPVVRLFGVTEAGNSVQCNAHGFTPYFFVPAPPNFKDNDCELFRTTLNKRMEEAGTQANVKQHILEVKMEKKDTIMGYTNKTRDFLRITVALPKQVPTCRTIMESGFSVPGYQDRSYQTYESNLPFILRFMVDQNLKGASWVKLPFGTFKIRPEPKMKSNCQLEVDIGYEDLIMDLPDYELKNAPLRILSFDIECAGRKGVFPEPDKDPVIQIANLVTIMGEKKPFLKNVFNLKSCSSIVGAEVICCEREADLLLRWARFVLEVDPDVIIGYNSSNFDFPYIVNRAKALKLEESLFLGRVKGSKTRVKDTTFSSKAYGTRESKETTIEGRVQFDLLQIIQRDYKLRSYTLNSVSAHFLNEQKEEVHYSIITDLFNGSDDDRRRLAVYCLKDAYLPQRLLDKLMIMYNYIEMGRVTGVPLTYLLSRGQQIKVISQLYRYAMTQNLLIPCYKITGNQDEQSTYEGATVIEPKRGFYQEPIATLDFSSLYPSIMMAHNLCYSTLLRHQDIAGMSEDDYEKTPIGEYFVKSHVRKGILPCILEQILDARKRAKDDLKVETDPFRKAVLDGRQLALKVAANSVYGFTGATVGKLPCLQLSASVTAYGREMIQLTKKLVEETYCKAGGQSHDSVVVYGDTDSVMVKFGTDSIEKAMELGRDAAKTVTQNFPHPIKLEFEKVYCPYLLISKKRYAGLLWTNSAKYDKIDAKGIETVRRDNCPLVKNVINNCLKKILIERNPQAAQDYTKAIISDLLQNRIDLSLLVISKALSKQGDQYANKQAHVELAERMKKRDSHTAPAIGDRVPYVIVRAAKSAKAYEKAEDPLWVLEHNIPLDYHYYLENQLKNPIMRLFKPIMEDPKALLVGDHTRTISVPTPKTGGIVNFAVKKLSCMSCKAPLVQGETVTCRQCRSRDQELFQYQLNNVSSLEKQFAQAWTQCQVCQGSLHQTVLCTSRDCPIFYMRKKVQKDLEDAQKTLERFSW